MVKDNFLSQTGPNNDFSYYKKWIPQENFYYSSKHTGLRPNRIRSEGTFSKYASLDDKMDGFHYYLRSI